jgi:class 3 adenylate cyclase/tetratricopeptide (TPR) repeat protein
MAEPRRERKVVTVLFCDLVGFTSQAESMDPEDVEALLAPYHARVRAELERYGGTVEKFIGDAVMALFGAPVAHEDDPERAVRAALAIRDVAQAEGLELRIGITTGEALIRLDARPEAGEGMASGDVVNTAARLQAAAPVNGILVDETTYRATRSVVDYAHAESVEAKGKAQPIAVWQAVEARSRFGADVAHEARAQLVGRDRELSVLRDAFDRARHGRVSQLVTLVGVPGLGKSRLVYELSLIADADPELVTWRQGRCLAYGDGVTLWALAEIVKAQAGIAEQDTPEAAHEKIHAAVSETLAGSGDEAWVESHLRPLVGLEEESQLGSDRRGEAFSAWRRFLEGMAEQRPLVVVFEDLHWADESLLDFVDELVDWVTDVPLLVVATARPELLERRPGWGGGKLNATTLALAPLDEEQTALLLAELLDRPVLAVEDQQALLERAGGNPLYAEQFADLFVERGSTDELSLPETLQGIIAARVDGLPAAEKDLLQDAAVIGKVFWASALQGSEEDVRGNLHSLERKGFVRRQRRSSVEGQQELAFAHALVRDVSYGQIARADRVAKHAHVAEWIESLGRPDDHAEMVAHHWRSALELMPSTGGDGAGLRDRTRNALRNAGDRAFSLNSYLTAEKYYAEALVLWPDHDPETPDLLFRRARALHVAGDDRREQALGEAIVALLEAGAVEPAAEAEAFLAHGAWYRGDRDAVVSHFSRAYDLVADRDASAAKARVLALSARFRMLAGDPEDAIRIAREALDIAESLQLDELRAHALTTIGSSKSRIELSSGRPELEEALEIALAADSPTAATTLNNLGVLSIWEGDFRRGHDEIYPESARLAERFGDRDALRFVRGNAAYGAYVIGNWEAAVEAADAFIAECALSPHYAEGLARDARAWIRLGRGDLTGAEEDWAYHLDQARRIKDPQRLLPALASEAVSRLILGDESESHTRAEEALALARAHSDIAAAANHMIFIAGQLGLRDKYREIAERAPAGPWKELMLAGTSGDLRRAGDLYASFGAVSFEGLARLVGGELLIEEGRWDEGRAELEQALAFYRTVGATFFIERGEALSQEARTA